jgi:hypothetical protein
MQEDNHDDVSSDYYFHDAPDPIDYDIDFGDDDQFGAGGNDNNLEHFHIDFDFALVVDIRSPNKHYYCPIDNFSADNSAVIYQHHLDLHYS